MSAIRKIVLSAAGLFLALSGLFLVTGTAAAADGTHDEDWTSVEAVVNDEDWTSANSTCDEDWTDVCP